jgi:hypothetical protein
VALKTDSSLIGREKLLSGTRVGRMATIALTTFDGIMEKSSSFPSLYFRMAGGTQIFVFHFQQFFFGGSMRIMTFCTLPIGNRRMNRVLHWPIGGVLMAASTNGRFPVTEQTLMPRCMRIVASIAFTILKRCVNVRQR